MSRTKLAVLYLICCLGCGERSSEPRSETSGSNATGRLDFSGLSVQAREQIESTLNRAKALPNDAEALGQAAMVFHAYELRERAAELYERAMAVAPESFRWHYLAGLVLSELGQTQLALEHFTKAMQLEPNDATAELRIAGLLLESGRTELALRTYEDLSKERPELAAAHYGAGRALASAGRHREAIERLEQAAALLKDFGPVYYALALSNQAAGRKQQAERFMAVYRKLGPTRRTPFADPLVAELEELKRGSYLHHLNRGRRMEAANKLPAAVEEYLQAEAADPALPHAHVNLIGVYGRIGEFDKAERHYRRAVEINPSLEEAHYNYGVLCSLQKKYSDAASAYQKALRINPFGADAHLNLGDAFERQGHWRNAEGHYREALRYHPKFRLAHFRLGTGLFKQGDQQGALTHLRQTIEPEDEETPQFLLVLARACLAAGRHEEASLHARAARRLARQFGQESVLALLESEFPSEK